MTNSNNRRSPFFCVIIILFTFLSGEVRLKDIMTVENAYQKSLIGYGLVIGLDGTGDRSTGNRGAIFTVQTISNMLERFGITVSREELRTRNVAAIMVTTKTPKFGHFGSVFDVTVSSLGDATSLEGGVLLTTPLLAIDGTYYGQAQGPVSIGGFNIETSSGEKLRKNYSLVGRVPNGATLERDMPNQVFDLSKPIRFLLNEPDFVTATRIAEEINLMYNTYDTNSPEGRSRAGNPAGRGIKSWLAKPINAAVIELSLPDTITTQEEVIFFIAGIETLLVKPDVEARVVINERTGTIVAGGNVTINEVMISHGSLTIHVKRRPIISQPLASFSNAGQTVVEYITEITAEEAESKAAVIAATSTVTDLAIALNEIGLKPRDIIAIFQAIKQAGALNAKLIIM